MSLQPRQPAGIPVGGQFAATSHDEPGELDLPARAMYPDDLTFQVGAKTPWGPAQNVHRMAPGVLFVETAGHGGYLLSRERQQDVPVPLRRRGGWYEEDGEAYIVDMVHPDARPGSDQQHAEGKVRYWFPDEYEKATGTVIPFGESSEKDAQQWHRENAGRPVLLTLGLAEDPDRPGYVRARGMVVGDDGSHDYWVPVEGYRQARRSTFGAYTNVPPALPDGSIQVGPPPAPAGFRGIDTSGLSKAGAAKVAAELAKRWRDGRGRVQTLQEILDSGSVTGKSVSIEGGRRVYTFAQYDPDAPSAPYSIPVSKALWDSVEAPDTRSDVDRARQDWQLARHKVTMAWARPRELAEARRAAAAAEAEYRRLDSGS